PGGGPEPCPAPPPRECRARAAPSTTPRRTAAGLRGPPAPATRRVADSAGSRRPRVRSRRARRQAGRRPPLLEQQLVEPLGHDREAEQAHDPEIGDVNEGAGADDAEAQLAEELDAVVQRRQLDDEAQRVRERIQREERAAEQE